MKPTMFEKLAGASDSDPESTFGESAQDDVENLTRTLEQTKINDGTYNNGNKFNETEKNDEIIEENRTINNQNQVANSEGWKSNSWERFDGQRLFKKFYEEKPLWLQQKVKANFPHRWISESYEGTKFN